MLFDSGEACAPVISSQIDEERWSRCAVRADGGREAGVRVMMRPGVCGIDQWMSRRD